MKIIHFDQAPAWEINVSGVKGVTKRILIGEKDGAPNVTMRMFHVEPGGYTYHHAHNFEHEIFIVEGNGEAVGEHSTQPITQGDALLIEPNEIHQIRNTGNSRMSFLCIIPNEYEQ